MDPILIIKNYPKGLITRSKPKVKILLSDIEDFQVSFLTEAEQLEEPEEWKETYSSATLPLAISITIVSKTFGEIRREFMLASGI